MIILKINKSIIKKKLNNFKEELIICKIVKEKINN
jgi:hypothetical protein